MADYPMLSQNPDAEGYKEEPAMDPTLRSETESGKVITRARFTRVPKRFTFRYAQLPNADKEILDAFEKARGYGSESFNWTNPVNSTVYEVRFQKPIVFELADNLLNEWKVSVVLDEV